MKKNFIKLKSQSKLVVRILVLLGSVLGGIFAFIFHPIGETKAQGGAYPFDEEFFDDEEYSEDFEEEFDEENDENMPQEIYDNIKGDTYDLATFEKAFQEVAYAYYMRGPRIEYNSMKAINSWFSPEKATTQDHNYLVCSVFTKNVYYELLGVKIPKYTDDLIIYAKKYVGNPEVVGYGAKSGSNFIMKIYDPDNADAVSGLIMLTNPNIEDIIPYLRIGDVLTYDGHTLVVYDLVYDEIGNVINAILMESGHGGGKYVKSKIQGKIQIGNKSVGSTNYYLYHNSRENTAFEYGLLEGTVHIKKITGDASWRDIGTGGKKYSILRFVQEDEQGNEVIMYHGADYDDREYLAEPISLSNRTKDRLKFSKLFIEKTVSEYADDMVELGSMMTYTIVVENKSNENYTDDLIITENLSEFVTYDRYTSTKEGIDFNQNGSTLTWNIGKLDEGEKVIIEYSVDVDKGNIGDVIVSTGSVGNIPSATIKNGIGKALNEEQETNIEKSFRNLKEKYDGKELIDKIYEESLGVKLNFKELNITNLINNTSGASTSCTTISGNKDNPFSGMILNDYWSIMALREYNYENILMHVYLLKYWKSLSNQERRADTINPENFRTGDVLIYINIDDKKYYDSNGTLKQTTITYENGEYAYIYIDGKFVGVNLGNDRLEGTNDDRNEFTTGYYGDKGLSWYSHSLSGKTGEFKEWLQYQTLFGKDAYVILRPSLSIRNITYIGAEGANNEGNPTAFILGKEVELTGLTKDGYTFDGWYTDQEYTNQVNNTSGFTDDVVLYAKWGSNLLPCTFQGQNIIHGDSLTVYSTSSTTCPNTCITGTVTCDNGTVLGDTGYTNLSCSLVSTTCDSGYTLTSTGAHGVYGSCTPYTASSNSCTPGTTVYKLTNCASGYHTEDNATCISNTKYEACIQSGKPTNSTYITGNVQVTWSGTWNTGNWTQAINCSWACNSGYTKIGNECKQDCSVPASLGGGTITHGTSITGYEASSVPFGSSCVSQTRICIDGTLSGSYEYPSCTELQPGSCVFDGNEVRHGGSVTGYKMSTVPYGQRCESETRTCTNGHLSGSYEYGSCSVENPASCEFSGNKVNHGGSVTGYKMSTVPYGQRCESETRTCANGRLSGSFMYSSCSVENPASCEFSGNKVNHGESVTGYKMSTVPYGQRCESETRTCINGELSGSFIYSSCSVQLELGKGWGRLKKDNCPNGDYSDSYYDGKCGAPSNNTHNSAGEIVYDTLGFNPHYSDEMNQAYQYAYHYGITTKSSIVEADMNGKLTRIAMAKMLSQYAVNVLGITPDQNNLRNCKFSDVTMQMDRDYNNGVTLACQLGIMGVGIRDFRPKDTVTRAEFVTALSRLLYGIEDGKDVYYSTHMNLLKYLGIITNTDPKLKETRGYVMLMLMRSENN